LSACSSALSCRVLDDCQGFKLGLPGGFMCAACPCVLGSLWDVAGASTSSLILTFYHILLSGDRELRKWPSIRGASPSVHNASGEERVSIAEGLAIAQLWLRSASMEQVIATLPPRGPTAVCLRARGWLPTSHPQEVGTNSSAGQGRIEQVERGAGAPFASPFYWAGFVVLGEG